MASGQVAINLMASGQCCGYHGSCVDAAVLCTEALNRAAVIAAAKARW
jgi:hypothetical protein